MKEEDKDFIAACNEGVSPRDFAHACRMIRNSRFLKALREIRHKKEAIWSAEKMLEEERKGFFEDMAERNIETDVCVSLVQNHRKLLKGLQ